MYITQDWFLNQNVGFGYPNLDRYEEVEINYAIKCSEEWIADIITGGLIQNDIDMTPPKLKIVEGLITAYDESNKAEVSKAKDIRNAIGRGAIFVLETGFNFLTGTFTASLGDRSMNESFNFDVSKESCEDYIKTLLAKHYETRVIAQDSSVQYENKWIDGGLINGEDRPISWAEADRKIKEYIHDLIKGESPIEIKKTGDPNQGITIACDNCSQGGTFPCIYLKTCTNVLNPIIDNYVTPKLNLKQDNLSITQLNNINNVPNKAETTDGITGSGFFTKSPSNITLHSVRNKEYDFTNSKMIVRDPIINTDPTTKKYVDNQLQDLNQIIRITKNDETITGIQILSNLTNEEGDKLPIVQVSQSNGQITIFNVFGGLENYKAIFQTYPQNNSFFILGKTNPQLLVVDIENEKIYYGRKDDCRAPTTKGDLT